ncbi:MAG: AsmA-like C-terminal domain-containing protein, partial [Kiloniellales bacterium]
AFGDDRQGGPTVTLAGSVKGLDLVTPRPIEIAGKAQVAGMPAELLDRYWPETLATNARDWVVPNVTEGLVESAEGTFALGLDAEGAATLRELEGTFVFRDLAVHYLRPLPPVEGIAGTARFDADTMTFEATAGHLGNLAVQSGEVRILDLREDLTRMTVAVKVSGPVPEALTLLDHPRLDLLKGLGIDPTLTGGQAVADLELAFPLPKELYFEQIDLAATAHLENASAKRVLLDQDVTEGTLDLVVDRQGMTVTGPARFAGIPLEAEWREEFNDKAAFTSRVSAKVPRVVEEDWRRFGIEPAPLLSGPVSGALVVTARRDGSGEISTAIDLREASLQIAPLLWKKPQGKAGTADLLFTWRPGHPLSIPKIEVDAGTLYARGRAELAEDNALALLELDRLAYEGTDLQGVRVDTVGEGYKVRIVGGVLDLAPFLAEDEAVEQVASSKPDVVLAEEEAGTPLDLEARQLLRLSVGPERYLEGVSLSLRREVDGWDKISVSGEVPQSLWSAAPSLPPDSLPTDRRRFRFQFMPDGAGGHTLSANADDLGAVLRAFDLIDTLHGGRLEISGQSDPAVPDGPVNARIEAKDYVLVDAPVLAKLLTLASLTGISNTLSGEGIVFQRLVGEFTLKDGKIETELVRAYGAALGLTAEGTVDIDGNAVDLRGTVVPAYTINRVLGAIPLVGPIITGGEGEGLLAFTYRANGPLDNPEVSVNPLSVLAPGFLRSLFGIFSGNGSDDPANPPRALPQGHDK